MRSEPVLHIQLAEPVDADLLHRLTAVIERVQSKVDVCDYCGQRLSFIRLVDNPTTRYCAECADEEEWRPGP